MRKAIQTIQSIRCIIAQADGHSLTYRMTPELSTEEHHVAAALALATMMDLCGAIHSGVLPDGSIVHLMIEE